MRWVGIVCACLVAAGCTTATGGRSTKGEPVQKPHQKQPVAQRIDLVRWQMAVTAEVAYRDPDPQKRRAFIDFHGERVALYLVLREHEHDEDAAAITAAGAVIREIKSMRSPEAAAYCAANAEPLCALPKLSGAER